MDVRFETLVSQADLTYTKPVERPEAGMPVGNGRMGSLVWTEGDKLKFQINRVDVFAADSSATDSQLVLAGADTKDYCCGCAFLDIDMGGGALSDNFRQHLSVYDGLMTLEGGGVNVQVLAWHERDVMLVQIEDRREQPADVAIDLRMLRSPVVRNRNHTATSSLAQRGSEMLLTQVFSEADHLCRSAVAVAADGRETRIERVGETTLRLIAKAPDSQAAARPVTILIATAASLDRQADVAAAASDHLHAAQAALWPQIVQSNKTWWHDFWSKSFVYAHSPDGLADRVCQHYTWYLYVMASSSRGDYPPKFNGMIWSAGGDLRTWGAQFWWHNTEQFYWGLLAANHAELMQPVFKMYSRLYANAAAAARQQWGSEGIYIAETENFGGPKPLPDPIAGELRAFLLGKKPYDETSEEFRRFSASRNVFSSRWNWKFYSARPPYSYVTHIFSSGAKIAWHYWRNYEYTRDPQWLRQSAYPMLKGIAEFYRNHPNLIQGEDGKVHFQNANCHEGLWGCQDSHEELSAMRGVLPLAVRASEILDLDAPLRKKWQAVLDRLAPLPTNDHPRAVGARQSGEPRTWVPGLKPCRRVKHWIPYRPCVHYDLVTLETPPSQWTEIARASFQARSRRMPEYVRPLSHLGIAAAMQGEAEKVEELLPKQALAIGHAPKFVLPNRMLLAEGRQSQAVEHLGPAAYTMQLALCQSKPPRPGADPVIRVFPAWPKKWDAAFKLLCRRGFVVSSVMRDERVPFVEIESKLGGVCHIRNPWPGSDVTVQNGGAADRSLRGDLLSLKMDAGEQMVLVPEAASAEAPHRVVVPPSSE